MPLGTQVGIGPGHIVLDGDPAHPKKGIVYCGQMVAHLRSFDVALRAYIATAETNKNTDQVETLSHFSTDLTVEMRSQISC